MLYRLKQLDWVLVIVVILLVCFGLASIYSSSLSGGDFSNFYKQLGFFGIGLILMFGLSFIGWRIFRESSYLILTLYIICLAGLAGLFFFAPEIRGVKGWYKVGPISIDPIAFTKIVLIILLAKYFSKRHVEVYRIKHILLSGSYILIPFILIFLQPDLGSALILIALWVGILLIAGIKIRHFLVLCLCGVLVLAISWGFLLKDYQKDRILNFINPSDPLGLSWSQNQAKIAIGSGGVLGQGLGSGSQTQYGFLPETQTDFIFAALAEELGLIGVLLILSLYIILISRVIKIATASQSNFPRLFAVGFTICLIFQIFIHVGMNLGISPIIGISLPLISYGGSGLIANLAALGILQSIKKEL